MASATFCCARSCSEQMMFSTRSALAAFLKLRAAKRSTELHGLSAQVQQPTIQLAPRTCRPHRGRCRECCRRDAARTAGDNPAKEAKRLVVTRALEHAVYCQPYLLVAALADLEALLRDERSHVQVTTLQAARHISELHVHMDLHASLGATSVSSAAFAGTNLRHAGSVALRWRHEVVGVLHDLHHLRVTHVGRRVKQHLMTRGGTTVVRRRALSLEPSQPSSDSKSKVSWRTA
jgi:hypothetical protein